MFKYMSTQVDNYKRFKESLDIAMTGAADHMVRVGYLLMKARDTDILKESGYSGMGEFAQKEYGLSPDQTSRFIGIAERYGDGEGRLQSQWQQYGYSKLSEMLSIPEEVAAAIPPEISREEIRELKTEIKKELETTPIELAIEKAETDAKEKEEGTERSKLAKFLFAFFEDHPQEFKMLLRKTWELSDRDTDIEAICRARILDTLCSGGIGILSARIPGEGGHLLTFNGEENEPYLTSSRTGERETAGWIAILRALVELSGPWETRYDTRPEPEEDMWSQLYSRPFPKEEEKKQEKKTEKKVKIAPAQTKKSVQKPEKIISDQPITVTGSRAAGETKTSGTVEITEEPSEKGEQANTKAEDAEAAGREFMNPPEESEEHESGITAEGDILSEEERKPKIKEAVKLVNRLAMDLQDYGKRMERLTDNNNYDFVATLFFNYEEFHKKLMNEVKPLIDLLKMRWDDEDFTGEEETDE